MILALTSCEKGKPDRKKTDPGKIGSVKLVVPASGTQVQQYAKAELQVTFGKLPSTTLPYDPDPVRGGMDLKATFTGPGGTYTVPGFWDGSRWLIRFSPMKLGKYTYTVSYRDPDSKGTWSEGEINCIASTYKGFARIKGRYLQMSNGSMIFPVGHNNGWLNNVEQPTLAQMASMGENLLAFWQATPWDATGARAPIENATAGVGNYNQAACAALDGLVSRAEAANVFLQPTIWSHGELRRRDHPWGEGWWYNNGYSDIVDPFDPLVPPGAVDANGPCKTPSDFFEMHDGVAETDQWRLQKNFLRYLFARYGYSRAILNWIVIAEIDGTSGYVDSADGPELIRTWLQAVRDYWKSMDFYRWNADGHVPLAAFVTDWEGVSGSLPNYVAGYDAAMGLCSTDSYTRGNGNSLMAYVGGCETTALYQGSVQPCFHGEIGGQPGYIAQPQVAHDGLWSCISAGACMTPLQWCDGGSWVLLTQSPSGNAIRSQLQCVNAFMSGPASDAPTSYLGSATVSAGEIEPANPLLGIGWSVHTNTQGFAWFRTPAATATPFGLDIGGLDDGTYSVQWYNVFAGTSPVPYGAPVSATCTAHTLTLTYPTTTLTSLACNFRRTSAMRIAPPSEPASLSNVKPVAPPKEPGEAGEEVPLPPTGTEDNVEPPVPAEAPALPPAPPTDF